MRLIKKVSLYFKEGNSDKVYEIDLCDIGNERYVVNFRYGRRGSVLKEGTKTETAVTLERAEEIFNALDAEKRAKGYLPAGEDSRPVSIPSTPAADITPVQTAVINWNEWPDGMAKATLKRLELALEGKERTARFHWKTSRIIWKAGVMKLEPAAPFIIQLANKADLMQQYAAAWALGRLNNPAAVSLLQTYFKSQSVSLKRIAGEALLHLLKGEELQKHVSHFINSLPEPVKLAVENNNTEQLNELLQERVLNQVQPHYSIIEDLYAAAYMHAWIKPVLKEIILQVPLRPNYFRHIRHIYKLAELRDDFEITGVLANRFERESEMFSHKSSIEEDDKTFIPSLAEALETKKELSKRTSRLAYSNKTKHYLQKRTLRNLNSYGKSGDLNYVRMATGLLLSYDHARDYAQPFTVPYYAYVNGRYQQLQKQYPANARSLYLNQILLGHAPNMQLQAGKIWMIADRNQSVKPSAPSAPSQGNSQESGGIIKKIFSLFGGKKKEQPVTPPPSAETVIKQPAAVSAVHNDAPFIELWNKLPQAYIQLLVHGRMNEIHQFAVTNLQSHPDYPGIKEKIDHQVMEMFLISPFDIPADFGYKLAQEKYDPLQPDKGLVRALFYSRLIAARSTASQWVNENPHAFFEDSGWVSALLFCPHDTVRKWVAEKMSTRSYTPGLAELICGRVIATALSTKANNDQNNIIIEEAGQTILALFSTQLAEINLSVTGDLIKSRVASSQLLGLKILLLKKGKISFDTISNDIYTALLNNPDQKVRTKCFELLQELSTKELLNRQELIIHCCLSPYHDVRINIRPILKRMAAEDEVFGVNTVNYLAPYLMRKEAHEGLQKDTSDTLKNELLEFVKNADKEMVLRLVYSQYIPAQEFGIAILEKYIDPSGFTLRQVIAFGNHETLSVREWCWKYFSDNIARIKFEREEAIRLLDARWDDTREFARKFFSEHFTENDWSPETLVGIADSVRPDTEAYGRELITRFFSEKDGEEYLLKLSQHPGEKMQLFATNYLEQFATGNPERIGALEFYFRSVLSRVNKARVAKNRIFRFLLNEGKKSEAAASVISRIITDISATVSIEDKARCIEIMYELNKLYKLDLPLAIDAVEERNQ